jgi:hypothetical protein
MEERRVFRTAFSLHPITTHYTLLINTMADLKIKNQKLIKVGNSYAVTLDKEFVDRCQLGEGSDLISKYDEDTASVTFAKPETYAASQGRPLKVEEQKAIYMTKLDPKFLAWVDKTLEEDKEALDKLANL